MRILRSFIVAATAMFMASYAGAVVLNVKVPDGTKKCYVTGDFHGWSADDALEMQPAGDRLFTLDLPDVTSADMAKGYKYLCGRDWAYVEKDASGGEIGNRVAVGNPDVVGSWASVCDYSIETHLLTLNGIEREVRVYLPEGYAESTESYPVIYYNCVQQRYDNAGADDDRGDDFFGAKSWNAHMVMERLRADGCRPYILVAVNSMLAENTVAPHDDFIGTGDADRFLQSFADELMPYVASTYRTLADAASTTIVGADYSGIFSLYAAMQRPDLFGRCLSVSPMLWVNREDMESMAKAYSSEVDGQLIYVTAGGDEPQFIRDDASRMVGMLGTRPGAVARYIEFEGESHNDEAWGRVFETVLPMLEVHSDDAGSRSVSMRTRRARAVTVPSEAFEERAYTLVAGTDAANPDFAASMKLLDNYTPKGSSAKRAYVSVNDIPVDVKVKYYWNVARGNDASGEKLMVSPSSVGFSSKKTAVSWHRVAVLEDETVENIAAASNAFKVVTADNKIAMSIVGDHRLTATVDFIGDDKSFKINYGSVNSGSDMGAIIDSQSVSADCVQARIDYDFESNAVTVTETKWGQSLDDVKVVSLSATPAVCRAGSTVNVSLALDGDADVAFGCVRDFTRDVPLGAVTPGVSGMYTLTMPQMEEGLYTISVSLSRGDAVKERAAEINVRVLPAGDIDEKSLTVNAYDGIDWTATGRYKANFHTHTSQSFDTKFTTTEVVDRYAAAGYKILALTDHDANPYPWSMFSLYNPAAADRDPAALGMLAVPGVELSKDRRNNWSEKTGGEYNHHNDFFTGRKGQEFLSLRESYAYTEAIGGMQIINHPGQYWSLDRKYTPGEKNSPEWHAENFVNYSSLIGLEVYNQGNRRPNDRILWDKVLTLTMPSRPVWGYSCDDTHTDEQYFRNYQFMLMPELTTDALKDAMAGGHTVFSYEYTGSGKDKAPKIASIAVDDTRHTITVDTDADNVCWISGTHMSDTSNPSTCRSTVVGVGKTFDYTGFQGSYVRALLQNKYGETCTQPFGFEANGATGQETAATDIARKMTVYPNPAFDRVTVTAPQPLSRLTVVNMAGSVVMALDSLGSDNVTLDVTGLAPGSYVIVAATPTDAFTAKLVVR